MVGAEEEIDRASDTVAFLAICALNSVMLESWSGRRMVLLLYLGAHVGHSEIAGSEESLHVQDVTEYVLLVLRSTPYTVLRTVT